MAIIESGNEVPGTRDRATRSAWRDESRCTGRVFVHPDPLDGSTSTDLRYPVQESCLAVS